jgi:RNA polymerase sigma factor (sigma-70 family)
LPHQDKYSEEELIYQLKMQDQTAFGYLYANYSGALNGIIYRMVNDVAVAEDILQEAFVKIWNNFAQYDASKGRLFTWMANITRNLTIDTMRSKGYKNQQKTASIDSNDHSRSDNNSPAKFDGIGIDKSVGALRPEYKKLIDLAYYSGYTQEEISQHLAIPLGTVKTRMRSAIIELRKTMT